MGRNFIVSIVIFLDKQAYNRENILLILINLR